LIFVEAGAKCPQPPIDGGAGSRSGLMENLIADVAAGAGVAPDVARKAVALILDFLKREVPEDVINTLFDKAPALRAIAATAQTGGEGLGGTLRSLMGTGAGAMGGGGLMALGGDLMNLGLDMNQVQTVGKSVFAYARAKGGDELVGEISAAVPGLAQYI
jgi:hypothetical protein